MNTVPFSFVPTAQKVTEFYLELAEHYKNAFLDEAQIFATAGMLAGKNYTANDAEITDIAKNSLAKPNGYKPFEMFVFNLLVYFFQKQNPEIDISTAQDACFAEIEEIKKVIQKIETFYTPKEKPNNEVEFFMKEKMGEEEGKDDKKIEKIKVSSKEMSVILLSFCKDFSKSFYENLSGAIENAGLELSEGDKQILKSESLMLNLWIICRVLLFFEKERLLQEFQGFFSVYIEKNEEFITITAEEIEILGAEYDKAYKKDLEVSKREFFSNISQTILNRLSQKVIAVKLKNKLEEFGKIFARTEKFKVVYHITSVIEIITEFLGKHEIAEENKKVENLENFPFKNYKNLKKAIEEGTAGVDVDRMVALQWVQGEGIYCPKSLRSNLIFLSNVPFLSGIGLIIYSIVSGNWWLLLSLPILLASFFILHPGGKSLGIIRTGLLWIIFIAFIYSFFTGINWLSVLTATLIAIWWSQKKVYEKAIINLITSAIEHEDLLCTLWKGSALNIFLNNGDRYWIDFKIENGKMINYESSKLSTKESKSG